MNFSTMTSRAKIVNEEIVRISKETGIPLIATNDVHFINEEMQKRRKFLLYSNRKT